MKIPLVGLKKEPMNRCGKFAKRSIQMNFIFATVIRIKKKLNVYLDCCILEAYTTIQNNQPENFGMNIFL